MKNYSNVVMEHYSKVAQEDGDSPSSTMKDSYIRDRETEAILSIVKMYSDSHKNQISIVDVGCGNGYTLSEIAQKYPGNKFVGIEKNEELRRIAYDRFERPDEHVYAGDILADLAEKFGGFDVVLSQRVIINLLDETDQRVAIRNLRNLVKENGILILLECFESGLKNLNEARAEYGLSEMRPSFHNMYLRESILDEELTGCERESGPSIPQENFLSSHYYITRVLHDLSLQGKPFIRNSHFVRFLSDAVPKTIGNYSPIKLYVYRRLADE